MENGTCFANTYVCILLTSSWNKTIKQRIPNLRIFLTNIYYDFSFNWQTGKKTVRTLVSFLTAQSEKTLRKKLGKTRFVVWWFDPTSSLIYTPSKIDSTHFM